MSAPTATPATPATDDLFSPPAERVRADYFGEITTVDIWECVLRKGPGKVKFDPRQHADEDKRTAVNLQVTCTTKDGASYTIDQEEINTSSKWRATLESLKALGINNRAQLLALKGQFAHIRRVATGGTYVAKNGARAGERVPEQALAFQALYPNQAASDAAEAAFWDAQRSRNGSGNGAADATPMPTDDLPSPPASSNEKAFALTAARALWTASGGDQSVFANMIATNPIVSRHYRIDSPEIAQIMGSADAPAGDEDLPF